MEVGRRRLVAVLVDSGVDLFMFIPDNGLFPLASGLEIIPGKDE